jgi:hypothetical protein
MDLVIIMLGTKDLKPVFSRTPLRLAIGARSISSMSSRLKTVQKRELSRVPMRRNSSL